MGLPGRSAGGSPPSVLEQAAVEDALYAAADQNGVLSDDGERQCWATIRSRDSAPGLLEPISDTGGK